MSIAAVNADAADAQLDNGRDAWAGITRAWLAEVFQRTGSTRTPVEYGRYVARFATPLAAQGRARRRGPSGRARLHRRARPGVG